MHLLCNRVDNGVQARPRSILAPIKREYALIVINGNCGRILRCF